MKKKRIVELYRFLSGASMKKMQDDEKVAFIKLLREMKPVFTEMQSAANDALEQARKDCDDNRQVMAIVDKAMEDLANAECEINVRTMKRDTFERLCLSNDWPFAAIDELEQDMVVS